MAVHVLDAMAREGFEEILALHDRRSGVRAFLAIHDTSVGPAFGGIRRRRYASERSALQDCLRLAHAMTRKCALAEIPGGGGKMVLLDRRGLDRRAVYRFAGACIERLGGRFLAGPDLGTGWDELAFVAEESERVTRPGPAGPGELSEATCAGVLAAMAAALRHLDGEEDWPARTVVVQGLGSVGAGMARLLVERGARVLGSDVDSARAARVRAELGIELLEPGSEIEAPSDVFCPCALGGILHDVAILRLRARIVCGAANNLLARSSHGERLHERGILFLPDFVVNSGALIRGSRFLLGGSPISLAEIGERIARIAVEILARASEEGASPAGVALREADRRIRARRRAHDRSRIPPARAPQPIPPR
jgi:leucine dehydrogenase